MCVTSSILGGEVLVLSGNANEAPHPMWTEIDIGRVLSSRDLQVAFAATFGVAPGLVRITDDITSERDAHDPNSLIVVKQRSQQGEFPQRLMIVLTNRELEAGVGDDETSIESYAKLSLLAENMQAAILAADRQGDPYAALMIEPNGNAFHVDLDSEYLDETDGVKLVPESNRVADSKLSHLVQRVS